MKTDLLMTPKTRLNKSRKYHYIIAILLIIGSYSENTSAAIKNCDLGSLLYITPTLTNNPIENGQVILESKALLQGSYDGKGATNEKLKFGINWIVTQSPNDFIFPLNSPLGTGVRIKVATSNFGSPYASTGKTAQMIFDIGGKTTPEVAGLDVIALVAEVIVTDASIYEGGVVSTNNWLVAVLADEAYWNDMSNVNCLTNQFVDDFLSVLIPPDIILPPPTPQACEVSTPDIGVELDPVERSALKSPGDFAESVPFTISVNNCGKGVTPHLVFADNSKTNTSNTLSLSNTSTAKGVGIQIIHPTTHNPIFFGAQPVIPSSGLKTGQYSMGTVDESRNRDMTFSARYIRTNQALEAGNVNASTTFTVIYE